MTIDAITLKLSNANTETSAEMWRFLCLPITVCGIVSERQRIVSLVLKIDSTITMNQVLALSFLLVTGLLGSDLGRYNTDFGSCENVQKIIAISHNNFAHMKNVLTFR